MRVALAIFDGIILAMERGCVGLNDFREWFANSVNLDEVRTAGYTKWYASGDDDQIPFLCNSQLDRCLNSVAK